MEYIDEDRLLAVLEKGLKEAQDAYQATSQPNVKDRLSYLCGLLETTIELLKPYPEEEQEEPGIIKKILSS